MAALRVVVGSTNKAKLEASRIAYTRAFTFLSPSTTVEVVGVSAPSGVPDQPVGDTQTRTGAFTRAYNAANIWAHDNPDTPADFCVGMEGGVEDAAISFPALPLGGAGASSMPMPVEQSYADLTCFAWMCVLHVPTGRWGYARTGSFSLPPPVALLVRGGMELGDADDAVFGRSGSKQGEGAVGILTHGAITRATYYEHALLLALTPFMHEPQGSKLHMQRDRAEEEKALKKAPTGLYDGHAQMNTNRGP